MRWLILGPYPPEQGTGAAAAVGFAAERLAAGDTVHAVSPRPSAAHEHRPLEGLGGIRALWRTARREGADGLWWRVEPGIVLRRSVDRRQALVERAVLALVLHRFRTVILDVGDVGLLPGGRAGRPVLAAAHRFVAHSGEDASTLVANGAAAERIDRSEVGARVPERPVLEGDEADHPEPDYPEPAGLRDLAGSREAIESALRARATELTAARGAVSDDPG